MFQYLVYSRSSDLVNLKPLDKSSNSTRELIRRKEGDGNESTGEEKEERKT